MKISRTFPQFTEETTLLIVAARQTATVYKAHKGTLRKITHIFVSNPTYSDREGFFVRSGKGRWMGSGSVYESKSESTHKEFLKEFTRTMKKLSKTISIDAVYLFASPHLVASIRESIPSRIQRHIAHIFRGNFVQHTPSELLEKIKAKNMQMKKTKSMQI